MRKAGSTGCPAAGLNTRDAGSAGEGGDVDDEAGSYVGAEHPLPRLVDLSGSDDLDVGGRCRARRRSRRSGGTTKFQALVVKAWVIAAFIRRRARNPVRLPRRWLPTVRRVSEVGVGKAMPAADP
jgi:hypothetical protein